MPVWDQHAPRGCFRRGDTGAPSSPPSAGCPAVSGTAHVECQLVGREDLSQSRTSGVPGSSGRCSKGRPPLLKPRARLKSAGQTLSPRTPPSDRGCRHTPDGSGRRRSPSRCRARPRAPRTSSPRPRACPARRRAISRRLGRGWRATPPPAPVGPRPADGCSAGWWSPRRGRGVPGPRAGCRSTQRVGDLTLISHTAVCVRPSRCRSSPGSSRGCRRLVPN